MDARRFVMTVPVMAALVLAGPGVVSAASPDRHGRHAVQLEYLDRGLVAVRTTDGAFLSWRLRGSEVSGHTATGMAGPNFAVYRNGRRIATVTDSTNYVDRAAPPDARYQVAAVVHGREIDR